MLTNTKAKTILVYGDSYTFGKVPGGLRYDATTRFTGVMQAKLGDGYDVVEEGMRGRFLEGENPFFQERNGLAQFGPIYASHVPVDLVIFVLGTNDTNSGGGRSAREIAAGYAKYMEKISWWSSQLEFPEPKVMLVAPPPIDEAASYGPFQNIFKGAGGRSKVLPAAVAAFAQKNKLDFFDASEIVHASPVDGIHLSTEDNKRLGLALAVKVKDVIG